MIQWVVQGELPSTTVSLSLTIFAGLHNPGRCLSNLLSFRIYRIAGCKRIEERRLDTLRMVEDASPSQCTSLTFLAFANELHHWHSATQSNEGVMSRSGSGQICSC